MASNGLNVSVGVPTFTGSTTKLSEHPSKNRPPRRRVEVRIPEGLAPVSTNTGNLNDRFPSLFKLNLSDLLGRSGTITVTRGTLRLVSSPEPMSKDDFQPSLKFDSNTNIDAVYFLPQPDFTGFASIQLSIDPLRDDETRQFCRFLRSDLKIENGLVLTNKDAEFQVVQRFQA